MQRNRFSYPQNKQRMDIWSAGYKFKDLHRYMARFIVQLFMTIRLDLIALRINNFNRKLERYEREVNVRNVPTRR